MRKKFLYIILLYSVTLLLAACSSGPRYHIAVLQCSVGNWRFQLNNELMAAQHLFEEDVEVEILNCFDRSDVQVRQIDPCSGVDHKQAWLAVYEYGGGDMSGRGDEKV